ncbi:hypothetical protein D3C77_663620 [compost metagenome]
MSRPVKRSSVSPAALTVSKTGLRRMPTLISPSSRPTRVVLIRTPSSSSTTASFCGASSAKSGRVGMRATVKLYRVAAPDTSCHFRSWE